MDKEVLGYLGLDPQNSEKPEYAETDPDAALSENYLPVLTELPSQDTHVRVIHVRAERDGAVHRGDAYVRVEHEGTARGGDADPRAESDGAVRRVDADVRAKHHGAVRNGDADARHKHDQDEHTRDGHA